MMYADFEIYVGDSVLLGRKINEMYDNVEQCPGLSLQT